MAIAMTNTMAPVAYAATPSELKTTSHRDENAMEATAALRGHVIEAAYKAAKSIKGAMAASFNGMAEASAATYVAADELTAEGKSLQRHALEGLAGYICGNRSLQSGVVFLEKLPAKARVKARDMLEIYLGWHGGKDSSGKFTRKTTRLLSIEKGVVFVNADAATELNAPTKKERAIAWQALCGNRPQKGENVKIGNPIENDPAKAEIDKLKKLVKGIASRERKRSASASSVKLGLLIDALCQCGLDLEEPILSSEDRKVFATSANFTGKPRTPK